MRVLPLLAAIALLSLASAALAEGVEAKKPAPAPAKAEASKAEPKGEAARAEPPKADAASSTAPALLAPKGPARIDFDDRLLQGQTNRLGAVYLYQRKQPAQASLLERRRSFREEVRRDLLE